MKICSDVECESFGIENPHQHFSSYTAEPDLSVLEGLHCWQHRNDKYKVWAIGTVSVLIILGCIYALISF